MKSYYCKRLYEDINFDAENVYVCCGASLGPAYPIPKQEEKFNYEHYLKSLINWRYNCIKNAYLGNISEKCKNCIELEPKRIYLKDFLKTKFFAKVSSFPIKNIVIKSYRQCEFACVYCLERKYTKGKKTLEITASEFYNFLPILNTLINKKLINNKDLRIEFQGGSFSVWDEFQEILDKVVNYGVSEILYHTNAYTYIPKISEYAKKVNSSMSISIDSGCKETFEKVKSVNSFDNVVENIIKYANSNINCSIKYILIKNLNDNLDEIKKYCNTIDYICSKIKDKNKISMMIDIDFRESLANKNYEIPKEYIEIFDYLEEHSKKTGIPLGMQDFIQKKLNQKNN